MHIFLDEAGNFQGDDYFIIGGFTTSDPRATAKAFRKWQQTKFPGKKLKYRSEVKFSDTRLDDALQLTTLKYFMRQNLRVFYSFLKTENVPLEYRQKGGIETGKLYTEMVTQTLDLLFPSTELEWFVIPDRRQLKKVSQAEFKETIRVHLRLKLPPTALVYVDAIDSTTNPNVQIADWICGALHRYYTDREHGKEFYQIMHGSIIASTEVFEHYWKTQHEQKTPPP